LNAISDRPSLGSSQLVDEMSSELAAITSSELQERALFEGVSKDAIEAAQESDDDFAAVTDLIFKLVAAADKTAMVLADEAVAAKVKFMQEKRQELAELTQLKELRERGCVEHVPLRDIEAAARSTIKKESQAIRCSKLRELILVAIEADVWRQEVSHRCIPHRISESVPHGSLLLLITLC
jgi:hypothetical protein